MLKAALSCVAALQVLAACVAAAQAPRTPTPSQVQDLLRADNPVSIAWGAHWASQLQLRDVAPEVVSAFNRTLRTEASNWPLHAALLDSLIQLETAIDANSAAYVLKQFPVQSLLLLMKPSSTREEVMLRTLRSPTTGEYAFLTIANVLLKSRPAGFAATLISDLPVVVQVHATDANDQRHFVSGGGWGRH
jgi:hypothetical protein